MRGPALEVWQVKLQPGPAGSTCSLSGRWHRGRKTVAIRNGWTSERISFRGNLDDHGWALSSSGLLASVGVCRLAQHIINIIISPGIASLCACILLLFNCVQDVLNMTVCIILLFASVLYSISAYVLEASIMLCVPPTLCVFVLTAYVCAAWPRD